MSVSERDESDESAAWKPLGRHERRVLGVLVEKAKTTPDNYPLSVAGLIAGCNQKSNRSPQMQLDEDEVLDALESLRRCGAAREIQGSGRVNKYRHLAYEWLGVNSPQAAIMTELLLRGPQTAGELRSRASRMEAFSSLEALGATLDELQQKGLVLPLTPAGRGQIFAHSLYEPDELRRLRSEAGGFDAEQLSRSAPAPQAPAPQAPAPQAPAPQAPAPRPGGPDLESEREEEDSRGARAAAASSAESGRRDSGSEAGHSTAAAGNIFFKDEADTRFAALEAELQRLRDRVARLEREFGLEAE